MLVLPIVAYGYTGPRDGFSRHDQQRLRALHAPRARHHQVAGLPRLQEDHPAQRPRLEHAEPRPGRPAHQPGDRRRVPAGRLVEPADGRQGIPAALAAEQVPRRLRHACELETSLYLYLDGDNVRKDKIKNGTISFNEENSPFNWVDLFAAGPATVISWTSSYSETGVLGRGRAGDGREGTPGLRGSGQATGAVRDLFQGPAQRRAPRPAPPAADHADALGTAERRTIVAIGSRIARHLSMAPPAPRVVWRNHTGIAAGTRKSRQGKTESDRCGRFCETRSWRRWQRRRGGLAARCSPRPNRPPTATRSSKRNPPAAGRPDVTSATVT